MLRLTRRTVKESDATVFAFFGVRADGVVIPDVCNAPLQVPGARGLPATARSASSHFGGAITVPWVATTCQRPSRFTNTSVNR